MNSHLPCRKLLVYYVNSIWKAVVKVCKYYLIFWSLDLASWGCNPKTVYIIVVIYTVFFFFVIALILNLPLQMSQIHMPILIHLMMKWITCKFCWFNVMLIPKCSNDQSTKQMLECPWLKISKYSIECICFSAACNARCRLNKNERKKK